MEKRNKKKKKVGPGRYTSRSPWLSSTRLKRGWEKQGAAGATTKEEEEEEEEEEKKIYRTKSFSEAQNVGPDSRRQKENEDNPS